MTPTHSRIDAPVVPSAGSLTALPLSAASLTGGFWADRQRLNGDVMIPHELHWEEKMGWIDNFTRALAGDIAGHETGHAFADSDIYKLIEAMTWEIGRSGDAEMEQEIQRLGKLIEANQKPDGYISTRFGNPGQPDRYTNFEMGHELYCFGHLFQAAVARLRIGRDIGDVIVRVAKRAAEHVCETFGADGWQKVCGHPEVETALVEFGRALGEPRYVEQARIFIDRRGHRTLLDNSWNWGLEYYQDETPFRDAPIMRGHAVRALYLCAGAIDVAVETGDDELLRAARLQYDNTVAKRTYITGGMGSHHADEGFGSDFELPPDRSYCESCAGVASVMCAWRLLLATGDMSYGDIIERTLFNMVAVAFGEDGKSFFYSNPLQMREVAQAVPQDVFSKRALSQLRAPWFEVSCCPPNVSRMLATLHSMIATVADGEVQVHQYFPSTVDAGGVAFEIEGDYPNDGAIRIRFTRVLDGEVRLALRIPEWAQGASVAGEAVEPGVHRISGTIAVGDVVQIEFPVGPRLVRADRRIDAVRGQVAVECGPVVMCAESVDLPEGMGTGDFDLVPGAGPVIDEGGRVVIRATRSASDVNRWSYGRVPTAELGEVDVPLIPFHAWGNRGPVTMRVWLPVAQ